MLSNTKWREKKVMTIFEYIFKGYEDMLIFDEEGSYNYNNFLNFPTLNNSSR